MGGKPRTHRTRRTGAAARAAILDAAERQLAARGPDGLRLQELAAEVGVSHPALLHHFGSREALVRAAAARLTGRLEQELIETIARDPDEDAAAGALERTLHVLADKKHARTLAWLYLSRGDTRGDPVGHGAQVRRIAEVVHAMRRQHCGDATPPFEDTLYTVALASFALFGHAVAAPALQDASGLDSRRFLRWLTRLLMDRLDVTQSQ
jgi:AcrR family transcriptional regulator